MQVSFHDKSDECFLRLTLKRSVVISKVCKQSKFDNLSHNDGNGALNTIFACF